MANIKNINLGSFVEVDIKVMYIGENLALPLYSQHVKIEKKFIHNGTLN